MVDWSKFKAEVFGSLPVAVLCLMLVIVSLTFPYWVTHGQADIENNEFQNQTIKTSISSVSFGLFAGKKTRIRGGSCTRILKWECGSGVCMLSCGENGEKRREDLDLVLGNSSASASAGDNNLCSPCKQLNIHEQKDGSEDYESDFIRSDFDPKPYMVRGSMLFTIIIMLIIGLLFTFINIIFTVLNIAHNPVSSIMGIDGLVIWNFIAGLMYLLVMILWGTEYNLKIRKNLGISDTLRPDDNTDVKSQSSIGWCCLLLICPMFLHLGMSVLFAWRQHDRYYNKKKKQEREMRINVQDPSQGGTDILF